MRHFKSLLLLGLIWSSSFSWAQSPLTAQDFQAAAQAIPQAIMNKNIKKLGPIDLATFRQKMTKVSVRVVPWTEFQQSEEAKRIGAQWRRDRGGVSITVNQTAWDQVHPRYHGSLALHEYLGALGYNDESYELSSSMWLLGQETLHKHFSPAEIGQLKERIESGIVENNGGVIGVGGGGDFMGPIARLSLLRDGLDAVEVNPANKAAFYNSYGVFSSIASVEGSWGFDPHPQGEVAAPLASRPLVLGKENEKSREFHEAAQTLISNLLEKGIRWVGNLNIKILRDQIKNVEVRTATSEEYKPIANNENIGALWRRIGSPGEKGQIVLNDERWNFENTFLYGPLALHLYLQTLGYEDSDGVTSALLWLLSQDSFHKYFSRRDIQAVKDDLSRSIRMKNPSILEGGDNLLTSAVKVSSLRGSLNVLSRDPSQKDTFRSSYTLVLAVKSFGGTWNFKKNP